jgi:crotonobetainyl-CoA:carnitine CoA-transferase CaiB-like acyl-CoA transferase
MAAAYDRADFNSSQETMTASTHASGALAGLRVIDLSRVLGGPYCAQYLADHGADVIKIEPPQGDETRYWGPFKDGKSAYFSGINRNKRNAAIDFSKPEGREILFTLLEDADVVLHNFKSGTLEKWGMGYDEVLSQRFPRLIYCQITGFGDDGPLGGLPGYDAVIQAMSGIMSVTGTLEGGPTRLGVPLVDIGSGLQAVAAILMAVIERGRSGLGQKIDIALYDCALPFLHPHASGYLQTGTVPVRTGNEHPTIAPYEQFETATGPMFLGVGNDGQFVKACAVLGHPELPQEERFKTNAERVRNRRSLHEILQPLLLEHDAQSLAMQLISQGVPAGAILDVPAVLAAPHTTHRGMIAGEPGSEAIGIPAKLSRTPGSVRSAPGAFGERTREICLEAGLSEEQIDALIANGVLFTASS